MLFSGKEKRYAIISRLSSIIKGIIWRMRGKNLKNSFSAIFNDFHDRFPGNFRRNGKNLCEPTRENLYSEHANNEGSAGKTAAFPPLTFL
jgi:hypothetical protein